MVREGTPSLALLDLYRWWPPSRVALRSCTPDYAGLAAGVSGCDCEAAQQCGNGQLYPSLFLGSATVLNILNRSHSGPKPLPTVPRRSTTTGRRTIVKPPTAKFKQPTAGRLGDDGHMTNTDELSWLPLLEAG